MPRLYLAPQDQPFSEREGRKEQNGRELQATGKFRYSLLLQPRPALVLFRYQVT